MSGWDLISGRPPRRSWLGSSGDCDIGGYVQGLVHAEDDQVTKETADKHATGSLLPVTEPWLTVIGSASQGQGQGLPPSLCLSAPSDRRLKVVAVGPSYD